MEAGLSDFGKRDRDLRLRGDCEWLVLNPNEDDTACSDGPRYPLSRR